ncbi:MAG: alcohol dehydrogenase catalytic domain-containing protein, partial [Acidimicrobiales bacterium]
MRQVQIDRYGGPEVLHLVEDVPDPDPAPGEVVVRTEAAGITFVDTLSRAGRDPRPGPPPPLPRVLGNGVAGLVDGRRVVTATGGAGGYADRVVVPAEGVIPVPDGVDAASAVALLADGRTA